MNGIVMWSKVMYYNVQYCAELCTELYMYCNELAHAANRSLHNAVVYDTFNY